MTNPFDPNYLTTASVMFGPLAWVFFLLQIGATAAGAYFAFLRQDNNAFRRSEFSRLGNVLMIIGGIGTLLGILRMSDVPLLNQRFWFYVLLVVELGLAGYIFYYARYVYPTLRAQSFTARGKARRAVPSDSAGASDSSAANELERVVPVTRRRGARRDRKRKNR